MKRDARRVTGGERVYKSIIAGLDEAVEHAKGNPVKVRTRKVGVKPIPHFHGKKIREIRNNLNLSQRTFSHVMGVSVKTVEAWETGTNEPNGTAQRVLGMLEKDNKLFEKYEIIACSV